MQVIKAYPFPDGNKHRVIVDGQDEKKYRHTEVFDFPTAAFIFATKVKEKGSIDPTKWEVWRDGAWRAYSPPPPSTRAGGLSEPVAGQVGELAKARIEATHAALTPLGFQFPPSVYAPGTRCRIDGDNRYQEKRQDLLSEGRTVDNAQSIIDSVASENREDFRTYLHNLSLVQIDGQACVGIKGMDSGIPLEERGLEGMFAKCWYTGNLTQFKFSTIASMFEDVKGNMQDAVKIRTRNSAVYAVLGKNYPGRDTTECGDADKVLPMFVDALDSISKELGIDFHGKGFYNPHTGGWFIDAGYMADRIPQFSAGDITRVRIRFKGNDAGSGAIKGHVSAEKNLCLNYYTVAESTLTPLKVIHKGEVASRVKKQLHEYITLAEKAATILVNQSLQAQSISAMERYKVESWEGVIEKLIKSEPELKLGIKRDVAVEALLSNWKDFGSEDNISALVDSVTRLHTLVPVEVAQEHSEWAGNYLARELE